MSPSSLVTGFNSSGFISGPFLVWCFWGEWWEVERSEHACSWDSISSLSVHSGCTHSDWECLFVDVLFPPSLPRHRLRSGPTTASGCDITHTLFLRPFRQFVVRPLFFQGAAAAISLTAAILLRQLGVLQARCLCSHSLSALLIFIPFVLETEHANKSWGPWQCQHRLVIDLISLPFCVTPVVYNSLIIALLRPLDPSILRLGFPSRYFSSSPVLRTRIYDSGCPAS